MPWTTIYLIPIIDCEVKYYNSTRLQFSFLFYVLSIRATDLEYVADDQFFAVTNICRLAVALSQFQLAGMLEQLIIVLLVVLQMTNYAANLTCTEDCALYEEICMHCDFLLENNFMTYVVYIERHTHTHIFTHLISFIFSLP